MPENQQLPIKVAKLEARWEHITSALDDHAKSTRDNLKILDGKIETLVGSYNELVQLNRTMAEMMQKHTDLESRIDKVMAGLMEKHTDLELKIDKVEERFNNKLEPLEKVVGRLVAIWEIITSLKTIIPTFALIGAMMAYYMSKGG